MPSMIFVPRRWAGALLDIRPHLAKRICDPRFRDSGAIELDTQSSAQIQLRFEHARQCMQTIFDSSRSALI